MISAHLPMSTIARSRYKTILMTVESSFIKVFDYFRKFDIAVHGDFDPLIFYHHVDYFDDADVLFSLKKYRMEFTKIFSYTWKMLIGIQILILDFESVGFDCLFEYDECIASRCVAKPTSKATYLIRGKCIYSYSYL